MSQKSLKRSISPIEEDEDEEDDYFVPLSQPKTVEKSLKMEVGKPVQPFGWKIVRVKKKRRKLYAPGIDKFFVLHCTAVY